MKYLFDYCRIKQGRSEVILKELFVVAERIKTLREHCGLTQSGLAKKLGLTRSSINSWEMGLSIPSTQYIVELAKLFGVSTDYLLGMDKGAKINVDNLSEKEVAAIVELVNCLLNKTIEDNYRR